MNEDEFFLSIEEDFQDESGLCPSCRVEITPQNTSGWHKYIAQGMTAEECKICHDGLVSFCPRCRAKSTKEGTIGIACEWDEDGNPVAFEMGYCGPCHKQGFQIRTKLTVRERVRRFRIAAGHWLRGAIQIKDGV